MEVVLLIRDEIRGRVEALLVTLEFVPVQEAERAMRGSRHLDVLIALGDGQ